MRERIGSAVTVLLLAVLAVACGGETVRTVVVTATPDRATPAHVQGQPVATPAPTQRAFSTPIPAVAPPTVVPTPTTPPTCKPGATYDASRGVCATCQAGYTYDAASGLCDPPAPPPTVRIPTPIPPPPTGGKVENVSVLKVLDFDRILIQRRLGTFEVEYGIGCLSMSLYEGRSITLVNAFGSTFIGIGASLVLPNGQTCKIWDSKELN